MTALRWVITEVAARAGCDIVVYATVSCVTANHEVRATGEVYCDEDRDNEVCEDMMMMGGDNVQGSDHPQHSALTARTAHCLGARVRVAQTYAMKKSTGCTQRRAEPRAPGTIINTFTVPHTCIPRSVSVVGANSVLTTIMCCGCISCMNRVYTSPGPPSSRVSKATRDCLGHYRSS